MSDEQLCDCGHPVSFHHDLDGAIGVGTKCGWCPPHSQLLCACQGATTTGIARDMRYRKDFILGLGGDRDPLDQVKLRAMSDDEIAAMCEAVLRISNGPHDVNSYATTDAEWHALARHLAFLAWHVLRRGKVNVA